MMGSDMMPFLLCDGSEAMTWSPHLNIFASSVLRNILASQYASLSICLHQREKIAYFLLVLQIQSQARAAIKFSEILRYKLFRSPNIKKYKPNYLRKSLIKTQFNSI